MFKLFSSTRIAAASAALLLLPSLAQATTRVVMPNHFGHQQYGSVVDSQKYGPIVLNPTSMLVLIQKGAAATRRFTISQANYDGRFSGKIACALNLLTPPRLFIFGNNFEGKAEGRVYFPPQLVSLNVGCAATVEGGGGRTAILPIELDVKP